MAKHTQKDAILAYFNHVKKLARNTEARTSKYIVFRMGDMNIYVGNRGAIRKGRTASESYAVMTNVKKTIIAAGMKYLESGEGKD